MSSYAGALALSTLIDPVWSAKRLPKGGGSILAAAEALERCAPKEVRSEINPLVDLEYIADRYLDGASKLSALDVVVRYANDLLPLGHSPHPLIDRNLFKICHPAIAELEKSKAIRSWVDALFRDPYTSEPLVLPFLDPAYIFREMQLNPKDLSAHDINSVSKLYLGEGAYNGIRPHPLFDPIYVHTKRTGDLPSRGALRNPGGFLIAELGSYIQQAGMQGRASPSIGFDEDLLRGNRHIADAVRRRLYANAFHAWVANSARMAGTALTASGIHAFPSCLTSKVWWRLDKNFALPRRRSDHGTNAAFLKAARQRLTKHEPPPVHAHIEGDLPHAIRLGQRLSLIIHGYAASPLGRLVGVEIRVGARKATGSFQGVPRLDATRSIGTICKPIDGLFCGFAVGWHGTADEVGTLPIAVRFRLEGLGRIQVTGWVDAGTIAIEPPVVRTRAGRPTQVAIAMATYNPKAELFRAQLDSIREQTLTDWRLVISDESTDEAARVAIQKMIAGDQRISLERGQHFGVVGNFERALSRLDRRSPYFALSDQDDIWYPAKLETLVAAIERDKAALVYGGMRIVTKDGRTIDPSFFSWRQPHGHSVEELVIVNTVTGAATLARMDLLALTLPIPRFASIYHDMWLALVAARTGRIVHLDEILQDYIQHDANVLGHSAREDRQTARRLARERHELERFIERIDNHYSGGKMRLADVLPNLPPEVASVWRDMIQRQFLNTSLAFSLREEVPKDLLTQSGVLRAAVTLSQLPETDNPRKFLNIPAWLACGAAALSRLPH